MSGIGGSIIKHIREWIAPHLKQSAASKEMQEVDKKLQEARTALEKENGVDLDDLSGKLTRIQEKLDQRVGVIWTFRSLYADVGKARGELQQLESIEKLRQVCGKSGEVLTSVDGQSVEIPENRVLVEELKKGRGESTDALAKLTDQYVSAYEAKVAREIAGKADLQSRMNDIQTELEKELQGFVQSNPLSVDTTPKQAVEWQGDFNEKIKEVFSRYPGLESGASGLASIYKMRYQHTQNRKEILSCMKRLSEAKGSPAEQGLYNKMRDLVSIARTTEQLLSEDSNDRKEIVQFLQDTEAERISLEVSYLVQVLRGQWDKAFASFVKDHDIDAENYDSTHQEQFRTGIETNIKSIQSHIPSGVMPNDQANPQHELREAVGRLQEESVRAYRRFQLRGDMVFCMKEMQAATETDAKQTLLSRMDQLLAEVRTMGEQLPQGSLERGKLAALYKEYQSKKKEMEEG